MERRTVVLPIRGQSHRVVTTASDGELKRLVAAVEAKVGEVDPRGRAGTQNALLLAAMALAHELEQERAKVREVEVRAREAISRIVQRIDDALDEVDAEPAGDDAGALPAPAP